VTDKDGTVRTLADRYADKRFNSPNDLTVDAKDRVYFTDPRYVGREPRELDTEAVYRVDPDGTITQIVKDVQKPNGLVLSADQKTLYLADSNNDPKGHRILLAYPINSDGSVGVPKKIVDFGADRGVDGMSMTADGLIVAAAGKGETAGVSIFKPDGSKVAFFPTPEDPSNCCFGGKELRTLYVTAGKSLYRLETNMKGVRADRR